MIGNIINQNGNRFALGETVFTKVASKPILYLFITVFALAISIGSLTGCSSQNDTSSAHSETRTLTDMRGRSIEIPANPDRIVAIGCALRPVCYLQAADEVVGIEASEAEDNIGCAYRHVNHDLFANLPIIGDGGSSGVSVNEEALMKVEPDLVICDSLSADEADNLQQKTGIPFVCLDQPETIFDIHYYDNLEFLGNVLHKEERASEVISYIKHIEQDLMDRSASSDKANTITAYAAGISFRGGHGFDGTEANFQPFTACDVTNIADGKGSNGAYTIDLESISSAQPDYIFMDCSNLGLIAEDYRNNPTYFNALNAIKDGNTYSLIPYRFYSTNVELALADCYQVGATVYPDAFADINPTDKLNEISEFFLGEKLSEELTKQGYQYTQLDIATMA